MDEREIENSLAILLIENKKSNTELVATLDAFLGGKAVSKSFVQILVRSVMASVCGSASDDKIYDDMMDMMNGKKLNLDMEQFKLRTFLLKKYITANIQWEVEALGLISQYLGQLCDSETTQKLLPVIFHILYEMECISGDAFLKWEDNVIVLKLGGIPDIEVAAFKSVSYTHLPLPTNREV